eukprot:9475275-Pyramimonas_sp.AAC.1
MAEAVDPAAEAPAGYASGYSDALSTVTDVTYDVDIPIDPWVHRRERHGFLPRMMSRLSCWICRLGKGQN